MDAFDKRIPIIIELGFRKEAIKTLAGFLKLLWDSNADLNLFSRKMTQEELVDNHVIDCLLALKHFPTNLKVAADFGTGGGLPGILYALHFSQTTFQLFEKSPKKQIYLKKCKAIAPNIEIFGEIPPKLNGPEIIISRAFKSILETLNFSSEYFKRGGKYFFLKGRKETIDQEVADACQKFKNLKVQIVPLTSPLLQVERHIVLI